MIKIAPSILSADFTKLGEEVKNIKESGSEYIHIDIMDGNFVPNISFGQLVVKSIRGISDLIFDVHLMIAEPDKYIDSFADCGADIITVHAETCTHLNRTIQRIKERGLKAAVALNPATSLSVLDYILEDLDMVLIMTVNPGFGGQSYIKSCSEKIRTLRNTIESKDLNIDIQVDGGIDLSTVEEVTQAGANVLVSGSAYFKSPDVKKFVQEMKEKSLYKF